MGATLKDVAKLAGVNFTLVSKYLNHNPAARMTSETKKKIDEAIKQLDYRPSMAARTLRSGRSHIIGLVCGDLTNTYFAHAADCALKECQRHGYQLLIAFNNPEKPDEALRILTDHGVDGIYGFSLRELPNKNTKLPCPIVTNNIRNATYSNITIDATVALDSAFASVSEEEITGLFTPPSFWEKAFTDSMSRIGKKAILRELSIQRDKRREQLRDVCESRPQVIFSNGWETMRDLMEMLEQERLEYQPKLILHANCCGPFFDNPRICGVVESSSTQLIQESCRTLIEQIETRDYKAINKTIPAHFYTVESPEFTALVRHHFHLT